MSGLKIPYEKRTQDFWFTDDRNGRYGLNFEAHLHYHMEIVYMKEGRSRASVDSVTYDIGKDDLLVVFPNRIHGYDDKPGDSSYDLIIVNPNLVPDLLPTVSNEYPGNPVIRGASKNKRLIALIDILRGADQFPTEYKQVLLKGYLTALFAEMLEMLPMKGANPDENHAIKTIVHYCSQNFTKDISLATLEEDLHLSKYYISHLFGEKLGIRFNDYVNSLRVSEACRLLRASDMNITEISGAAGFGTLRTFNRAFIKQTGMSPSEYKKENRAEHFGASAP